MPVHGPPDQLVAHYLLHFRGACCRELLWRRLPQLFVVGVWMEKSIPDCEIIGECPACIKIAGNRVVDDAGPDAYLKTTEPYTIPCVSLIYIY